MSAECGKCGSDLTYRNWPVGECERCDLESRLREAEAERDARERERNANLRAADDAEQRASMFSRAVTENKARVERLEAELQEAREALKPFAELAAEVDALRHGDESTCPHRLKAGHIRRAMAMLGKDGET